MRHDLLSDAMRHLRCVALPLVLAALLASLSTAYAAPARQGDPAVQCAEGVRLFEAGQKAEALPLLEAGFAGRAQAAFAGLDDLGRCAMDLGWLRNAAGNRDGALDVYAVALDTFRQSGNRQLEGVVLNDTGLIYYVKGQPDQAVKSLQQALVIAQEIKNTTGQAAVLTNMGWMYSEQGNVDQALTSLQQALALAPTLTDRSIEGTALNNLGSLYLDQGKYDQALDAYQRALTIRQTGNDRRGEGETLNNIGSVYLDQGAYEQALETLQQALLIMRELKHRVGEHIVLDQIGLIYDYQGDYTQALDYYQRSLAITQELGDREDSNLHNIAGVYRVRGQYDQALNLFQQALAISRKFNDAPSEGNTLNSMGIIYNDQGQYDQALTTLRQSLEIRRRVGDRGGEGVTLNNIGTTYHFQGQYAKALEAYQQALAVQHAIGEPEDTTLNNIGNVYQDQGLFGPALDAYQQALVIEQASNNRSGVAITLNNIGSLYHAQAQYKQAFDALEQALAIWRDVGFKVGLSATLGNIGHMYDHQKQYDQALETLQQALAMAQEIGDQDGESAVLHNIGLVYDHRGEAASALAALERALGIQQALGNHRRAAGTLEAMGMVYAAQGQPAQASASYQQALDMLEQVRATAGSEQARAGFIGQFADLYARAAALAHQQGQDDLAFQISERGRARAFLDSLATSKVQLSDQESQALLIREQESYAAHQAAQDALAKARAAKSPDAALIADLEYQSATTEQAHSDTLKEIAQRGDELAALVPGRTKGVRTVQDVQALLAPQTTLVSFFVADEQTLAFILTRDRFTTVALPVKRADLVEQVTALRHFATINEPYPSTAMQLYTWLIAPLKPHLTTPHLAIVPHDTLHYLPFAALTDGQRFLVDDYALTVLPSASSLQFIQQNTGHPATAPLIMGNPATNVAKLPPLEHAEDEAHAIARLYGVAPLLGPQATANTLRTQAAQAGIVHLAAHGTYNQVDPLASAIYLAPEGDDDGQLTARSIYGLGLDASDLVVLSACQTQMGERSAGDEVVGLTRAFFFAGTPSVIASLWSVDDATTSLLMERFYVHLRAGLSKAEALRQAQQEVRSQYPNPYYWAAFVLSGDAGPIQATLAQRMALLWPWFAGGGLLTVAVSVIMLWRRARRIKQPKPIEDEPDELLTALLAHVEQHDFRPQKTEIPPDQR